MHVFWHENCLNLHVESEFIYWLVKARKLAGLIIGYACLSACASVNEEVDHTGYAMFQAVRDFNVKTEPIPQQLLDLNNPFGHTEFTNTSQECAALLTEHSNLEASIKRNKGRRVGFRRDSSTFSGRLGNLRDVGVKSAATLFTPHRGIIQQLSGSAAHEQQAQKANERAHVRMGYIIGRGRSLNCQGF